MTNQQRKRKKPFILMAVLFVVLLLAVDIGRSGASTLTEGEDTVVPEKPGSTIGKLKLEALTGGRFHLMPGRNHNEEAAAYAVAAKDVQQWLRGENLPKEKYVFLTFDDGPSANVTPKVLDALQANGAVATFFEVAPALQSADPAILTRMIDEGHAIAIHTNSHNYGVLYPGGVGNASAIVNDYQNAYRTFRQVLGADFKTTASRYPGGHMSWQGLAQADQQLQSELGLYWIDWNAMNGDAVSGGISAQQSFNNTKATASPDMQVVVLLMHAANDKMTTAESLPKIINYFKDNGYEFKVIA